VKILHLTILSTLITIQTLQDHQVLQRKKVDEKIKIEDVPENIKKRLAPAPKKGMVLVKKKKVETKPVDDEQE